MSIFPQIHKHSHASSKKLHLLLLAIRYWLQTSCSIVAAAANKMPKCWNKCFKKNWDWAREREKEENYLIYTINKKTTEKQISNNEANICFCLKFMKMCDHTICLLLHWNISMVKNYARKYSLNLQIEINEKESEKPTFRNGFVLPQLLYCALQKKCGTW